MSKTITSEIVVAYSQCPRKAFLLLCTEENGTPHEYVQILQQKQQDSQRKHIENLKRSHPDVHSFTPDNFLRGSNFLVNVTLEAERFVADCGILTRVEKSSALGDFSYEPTIFVGAHLITKEHKLELSFVGYVLNMLQGVYPLIGRIIGLDGASHKVVLENLAAPLYQSAQVLKQWISLTPSEPDVILIKHCSYCEFKEACYQQAQRLDHLSLLKGISEKEIEKLNKKGIFTVTQYSYTYRPRRNRGKVKRAEKYHHSLQALAIRNKQIYVVHKPIIHLSDTLIFLDVEGVPDRNFYYLIGLMIIDGPSVLRFSFWANDENDEEIIWARFLETIKDYEDFSLLHYGSYDAKFIDVMLKRYPIDDGVLIDKIKSRLVNVLSMVYSNIYFPTHSNSLKDIGGYLGFKWSSENSSGLQSLTWRHQWESNFDEELKLQIINYNLEDCLALSVLINKIMSISILEENSIGKDVSLADDIKVQTEWRKFRRNEFALEELEFVNRCAYFDYQRDKVYFRETTKENGIVNKQKLHIQRKEPHVDQKVIIFPLKRCAKCGSDQIGMHGKDSKIVFDMKFFEYGTKKWVLRYLTRRVKCRSCKSTSYPEEYLKISGKYGKQLKIWTIYQVVALRQPYGKVLESLHDIFSYDLGDRVICDAKREMSKYYSDTYDCILLNLKSGRLIHVDETTVSIRGANAYVWVFTSLEEVIYMYSPTREGAMLKDVLDGFNGVLVSDFYPVYDSVECVQQKCLIHLVRDMNDDLLRNPFDEQYKKFIKSFSELLKTIIGTIDVHGLKKAELTKHKMEVKGFFSEFVFSKSTSEVVTKYQKRFANNQTKLFAFLDYDGIPWNNNNAEHAIKGFAVYRRTHDGLFTEKGIKEYLVLLSIYKTCEYKRVNFLRFLLSGSKDIDNSKKSH